MAPEHGGSPPGHSPPGAGADLSGSAPSSGEIELRLLGAGDGALLERAGADLFDHSVRRELAREFLSDPRHHMVAAVQGGAMIGFASGLHYVHPDKDPEMWIVEVGVLESRRREGVGDALVRTLLAHARRIGCREAWVLTDADNGPACALYGSTGASEPPGTTIMYTWSLGE